VPKLRAEMCHHLMYDTLSDMWGIAFIIAATQPIFRPQLTKTPKKLMLFAPQHQTLKGNLCQISATQSDIHACILCTQEAPGIVAYVVTDPTKTSNFFEN
jgi:hypothetical protein